MTRSVATPHREPTGHGEIGPHGVEAEPLEPHRSGPGRIEVMPLARDIDRLTFPQLERVAQQLLGQLSLVAEAPGTKIHADSLSHQKPGSQPPSSSPLCVCGCPSRLDHHRDAFNRALTRGSESDPFDLGPFRGAVLSAAFDLDSAAFSRNQPIDPTKIELSHERDERMLRDYEGWPADAAAAAESFRTGAYISGEAMRRMRRKNSADGEFGRPLPPADELRLAVVDLQLAGLRPAEIARELGIGRSSVTRILEKQQLGQEANA